MDLIQIKINDFGGSPVCEHNMPCAICHKSKAVLQMQEGIFYPCWECQKEYKLVKKNWFDKFLGR